MIKIDIDLSSEDYGQNWKFLEPYINQGVIILHYTHEGPGGGNPNFKLGFPNYDLLEQFIHQYEGYTLTPEEITYFLKLHQYSF